MGTAVGKGTGALVGAGIGVVERPEDSGNCCFGVVKKRC